MTHHQHSYSSQLAPFKLPTTSKKRKRNAEMIQEVFVKENIMVDCMHRNFSLREGVVGKTGLVIRELVAGIFLYNENFDLVFQQRSDRQLESTTQLIRIQNLINVDFKYAQQVYEEIIYEI
nr:hypothetical protein [Tanacetum cinerariifolium]